MIRTRRATAGIAAALVAACCALGATEAVEQGCLQARDKALDQARADALKELQKKVFGLKLGETKTVKDFIDSTDLPKTDLVGDLLQGAVEWKPALVYGDGECEVRVGLSGETLRANLKRILQQNYKKADGEFARLTFDGVGAPKVEAAATSAITLPSASGATVALCVEGWSRDATDQPISARKRIQTEHAAFQEGLAVLKAAAEKLMIGDKQTLGALMISNPLVKETVEKFFAKLPADQKLYWPKGIVEVRFALDYGALWTALEQANQKATDPSQRLAAPVLAAARERTKAQDATADTFAELDGKPVNQADHVQSSVPMDLHALIEPPPPDFTSKSASTESGGK
jgi:hypothetical protein